MTVPLLILIGILVCVVAGLSLILLIPPKEDGAHVRSSGGDVSVSAAGSIVTVRKVGGVTSVSIREDVHDHWEGEETVPLPFLSTEITRQKEPELFNEYLSPDTSAVRKYEIINELYDKGFTLPLIRGLHEQYKRETARERQRAPVNLTPQSVAPDPSLYAVPQPDMGEGPSDPSENL